MPTLEGVGAPSGLNIEWEVEAMAAGRRCAGGVWGDRRDVARS